MKNNLQLEFVDIRAALDDIGVYYTEQGKNVSQGWIGVNCPMPGCNDPSNHMGINLRSPVITCYNCGRKGNYLTYLAVEMNSWGKAIELIKKHTPRELKVYEETEEPASVLRVELPDNATKNPTKWQTAYLKGRGFNPKELQQMYDLYYCGPGGKFSNRIIIPVYRNNRLITFSSIDIAEDSNLRYKHLSKDESIIHCKNHLYGLEEATGRNIVVVEGFFDKLQIGAGCVCTFGTKVTPKQKLLLTKYSKAIIVFDGDEPGWIAGRKLAKDLSAFTEVVLVTLPEGVDPDELPKEDIKELQDMVKTKW